MKNPILALSLTLASCTTLLAADWPHWRGPNQDGISQESGFKADFKGSAPVAWKAKVGIGYSSFSVAEGKAYIMGWQNGQDTVYCFEAESGKPIWTHSYECPKMDKYHPGGPGATPTYHDGRLYTISKPGHFFCLDANTGKVLWKKDLTQELGGQVPTWGFTSSAVVDGDHVIVDAGTVGAFDRKTGAKKWASRVMPAGYATPILFERGGKPLLAVFNGEGLVLLDRATGKQVGGYEWKTQYDVNAASPIIKGDYIFISSGYGRGAAMLQMQPDGSITKLWENTDMKNQMNPSVLIGDAIYGVDGNTGQANALICMSAQTGKILWKQDGLGCGALMAADGKLIIFSEKGELVVAEAVTQGYKELARAQLTGSRSWTVPVLSNGRIYCRNDRGDVVCVDVSGK